MKLVLGPACSYDVPPTSRRRVVTVLIADVAVVRAGARVRSAVQVDGRVVVAEPERLEAKSDQSVVDWVERDCSLYGTSAQHNGHLIAQQFITLPPTI